MPALTVAMLQVLRTGKAAVMRAAHTAGVFDRIRDSHWRRRRLLILGYHGVSLDDEHEWNPGLYISPGTFASRLAALERGGYAVLPLAEALTALREQRLPPRSVALTFDDGSHDFYARVYPELRRRGYPATVYLTTYYCEYNRPIFRLVCSYVLWKARATAPANVRPLTGEDRAFDLASEDGRESLVRALVRFAEQERLSARDKDGLAGRLAALLGIDYAGLCARRILHLMSTGEVSELARHAVDFQLHTHRHNCPHDVESFSREIRDNRACIERLTNRPAAHFCYPCGRYRPYFLPWLEQEQVTSATTCDPGLATAGTAPLLLPRFVDTESVSTTKFEAWLSGAAQWLPGRRRYGDLPD